MTEIKLAPSLLSADWTRLAEAVSLAERGADWLHLDVMDGQFVPNLTFGPVVIQAVRRLTRMPLDVHLMIQDPVDYLEAFRKAGADWMSVHVEARGVAGEGWPAPEEAHGEGARAHSAPRPSTPHAIDVDRLRATLAAVRDTGAKVGLALRPDTSVTEVEAVLGEIDLLLVMSVYPGFSGQPFREEALVQIRAAVRWRTEHSARYVIESDGGITEETVERVVEAGSEVLVSGHGVYRQADPLAAMEDLRRRANRIRPQALR